MTVAQLQSALAKLPPDANVVMALAFMDGCFEPDSHVGNNVVNKVKLDNGQCVLHDGVEQDKRDFAKLVHESITWKIQ